MRKDIQELDEFERAYIECLLFTTHEDEFPEYCYSGEFSANEDDFSRFPKSEIAKIKIECQAFRELAGELLSQAGDEGQNGRDFAYTRNGHGVGFWDRGYPKEIADPLTDIAHSFGTIDLFKGKFGRIYIS